MAKLYLGRDNAITLQLQKNGETVPAGAVTRAVFWLPAEAAVDNQEVTFDTDTDSDTSLLESATKLEIKGGLRDLNPGKYRGELTLYDALNPNGIRWGDLSVTIKDSHP